MIDVGTLIADRYHILEQLPGPSSISRYTAQTSDGRSVTLLEENSGSESHLNQVANALQRVSHPSLPSVVETFKIANVAYLTLNVPPGRSLADRWQDPSVSDRQRLNWLLQLCYALEACKASGP